ncbi:hypothetical protein GXP69_14035 [Pontibacter sp. BT327]|uniref:DUF2268 domain-containing protein n=1 Tax=Pontibacter burrus TaxID=2704466 RepID=A0A6B3LPX3_9BACT|nr:hypothetical protein [Pontibacter burrus]NEM98819.1 hypothetical protein [Pontibacter burrus]
MKKTLTILVLSLSTLSCLAQHKFEVIATDVDLFWNAFDKFRTAKSTEDSIRIIHDEYISKGTAGVGQFMKGRIQNARYLQQTISKHKSYYSYLQHHTPKLQAVVPRMNRHYKRLLKLYPDAYIPKVYFVIGALNSAGTIHQDPVIGVDMFGFYPETPKNELSPWLLSVLRPIEQIDIVVFHEIVHILQKGYPEQEETLLKKSITEGAADFIGELVTRSNINKHIHAYANPREREL